MDQVKNDHAANKVAQLHARIQVQQEDFVLLLFCVLPLHLQIKEKGVDHIEEKGVDERERDDREAENLCNQDKIRFSMAALLRLVILAQLIEPPEQAYKDYKDCHFVNDLRHHEAGEYNDLVIRELVPGRSSFEQNMERPDENAAKERIDDYYHVLPLG